MLNLRALGDSDREQLKEVVCVVRDAVRAVKTGTAAEQVLVAEQLCGLGISIEGLTDAIAVYHAIYQQARADIEAELAVPARPDLRLVAGG
jgi:hypothetical protein